MTKYVHIVYVHPVENGEPNLHKVLEEQEFDLRGDAEDWISIYNSPDPDETPDTVAVYLGRVNDETGEIE